jgi:CubicO group peptidase (beta-lactamase class C family)
MKKIIHTIALAVGFLLSFGRLPAQDKAAQLDTLMQSFHRQGQFTGAVLVAEGGNVLYKRGFGQANVAADAPNQPNTVFFVASLTKPFTALLVMQLVEAGQLKLENTLAAYFPGLKNDVVRNATIGQLLSHTSGIPDFIGPGLVPAGGLTDAWLTEQLNKTTPEPVPAGQFTYANSTYIVLAHLIEKTLGKPFPRILKEKVFDKCGMTQSGSLVAGQQLGRRAKGYTWEGEVLTEARFLDPAVFQGAGSVYSTAEDLFMFDQALYSNALVSKKSRDLMFGSSTGYGYGWFIRQIPGVGKVVYHEGGIPGYNGVLFRAVERNYSVVLLSNHDADGAGMQPLTKSIIGVLMQKQ